MIDDPNSTVVTEVGDWGPWIVGGAWLTVGGRKVDLLYRCADAVSDVIRALSCVVQVLFALNRRYLVNEKGALEGAAGFPIALPGLTEQASFVWRAIGRRAFGKALDALRAMELELRAVTAAEQFP